jgi:hypothetical protein
MEEAILYVLAAPLPGTRTPAYLLYQVGGVSCVLAYTDLEHLVECCGDYQPWLGIQVRALMADLRDQRLPGPAINMPLGQAVRWTADGPPAGRDRFIAGTVGESAVPAGGTAASEPRTPEQAAPDVPAADAGAREPGEAAETGREIIDDRETAAVARPVAPAARKEWWR